MNTLKVSAFKALCKQHWPSIMDVEFVCPQCRTVQTGNDLVEVGAGSDAEEVNAYLGFSCLGRWDVERGCNWTLGGFFPTHKLELIADDDESKKRPCFELNLATAVMEAALNDKATV